MAAENRKSGLKLGTSVHQEGLSRGQASPTLLTSAPTEVELAFCLHQPFLGTSIPSHVTPTSARTPAKRPEKPRPSLWTVLPDPGLGGRRHQRWTPLPVPWPSQGLTVSQQGATRSKSPPWPPSAPVPDQGPAQACGEARAL